MSDFHKKTRKRIICQEHWQKNVAKKNRHKPGLPPSLSDCGHDTKRFQCKSLTLADIRAFHASFYQIPDKIGQDTWLLRYIKLKPVTRHRTKKSSPTERSSQYFIRTCTRTLVPVCTTYFCSILGISRFRLNRLTKKDYHNLQVKENRGGFKQSVDFKKKTDVIVKFLESLQFVESHYCRGKSERKYLPAELNIEKLYDLYVEKLEEDEKQYVAKRSYFRTIFNTKFNYGFGSPRTDMCSILKKKQILRVENAIHKKRAKTFFKFLQPPKHQPDGSEILDDTLILSFDCQKNLQLLKVPDSAAYYSRNVYLYNFTIVQGYSTSKLSSTNAVSYCWTENEYPKNANMISSCLVFHLEHTDLHFYKHIRLVADGCAGQNKNSILVAALLKWFSESAPTEILDIELVFPITGHSYIPPDRIFAQIEKQVKKKDTILAPQEYLDIISKFSTVRRVGVDVPVYDVKGAMNQVLKPCSTWPFSISQVKRLYIGRRNAKLFLKGELFYKHNIGVPFESFCKRNKKLSNLVFQEVEETNRIEYAKKEDLRKLLEKHFGEEWRSLSSLSFFVYLLDVSIVTPDEQHKHEDVDDPCECGMIVEQPELIV